MWNLCTTVRSSFQSVGRESKKLWNAPDRAASVCSRSSREAPKIRQSCHALGTTNTSRRTHRYNSRALFSYESRDVFGLSLVSLPVVIFHHRYTRNSSRYYNSISVIILYDGRSTVVPRKR